MREIDWVLVGLEGFLGFIVLTLLYNILCTAVYAFTSAAIIHSSKLKSMYRLGWYSVSESWYWPPALTGYTSLIVFDAVMSLLSAGLIAFTIYAYKGGIYLGAFTCGPAILGAAALFSIYIFTMAHLKLYGKADSRSRMIAIQMAAFPIYDDWSKLLMYEQSTLGNGA